MKSTSDSLHYFMILLVYTVFLVLIIQNQSNLLILGLSIIYIATFYILYRFKAMGIGDVFVMLWLSPPFIYWSLYHSGYGISPVAIFLPAAFMFGLFVSEIYAGYLLYRNGRKLRGVFLFLLSIATLSFSYLLVKSFLLIDPSTFFNSMIGLLLSYAIFYALGKRAENYLYFTRSVDELVEGDWVLEISIKGSCELSEDFKREFKIIQEGDGEIKISLRTPALNKKQMELLKELEQKGCKVEVWVKEGFPFVPAMFLSILSIVLVSYSII